MDQWYEDQQVPVNNPGSIYEKTIQALSNTITQLREKIALLETEMARLREYEWMYKDLQK